MSGVGKRCGRTCGKTSALAAWKEVWGVTLLLSGTFHSDNMVGCMRSLRSSMLGKAMLHAIAWTRREGASRR